MDSPSAVFARRMREARERADMSQVVLARGITLRLGVTVDQTTVARMERGERGIRLDEAVAIADVLNVPLARLLGDSDSQQAAEIQQLRFDLERAKVMQANASAEIERLTARLRELGEVFDEDVYRELAMDADTERWPIMPEDL